MFVLVPLMIETALSRNPGIPTFGDNLASYVRVVGNGNMSPILPDWKPWLDLGPDSRDPVPETHVN